MKTSLKIVALTMVMALGLCTARVLASSLDGALPTLLARASLGQTPPAAAPDVDELLRQARKAMSAGDLRAADALVTAAEKGTFNHNLFYVGDTPAKARHELTRLQQAQAKANAAGGPKDPFIGRPAQPAATDNSDAKRLATGFVANGRQELAKNNLAAAAHWYRQAVEQHATFAANEDSPEKLAADIQHHGGKVDRAAAPVSAPAIDPATGRKATLWNGTQPFVAEQPTPPNFAPRPTLLPPTDGTQPAPLPTGNFNYPSTGYPSPTQTGRVATAIEVQPEPAAPIGNDARLKSDALILSSRRALANGDVRRATDFLELAKSLHVSYEAFDDSPEKVESLAHKYSDIVAHGGATSSDGYRQAMAGVLMEESEALRRWKEFDDAERLATDAVHQQATFRPTDYTPQQLLQKIAADRRGGHADALAATTAPAADNRIGYAPSQSNNSPLGNATGLEGKAKALELTRQARMALARGDLAGAQALANQAMSLAPDSSYGLGEDRPGMVLLEVSKARRVVDPAVMQASNNVVQAGGAGAWNDPAAAEHKYPVTQTIYDSTADATHNVAASNVQPLPEPSGTGVTRTSIETLPGRPGEGMRMFNLGMAKLQDHKPDEAYNAFKQAWDLRNELDPATVSRLQDQLQNLAGQAVKARGQGSALDAAAIQQQTRAHIASNELSKQMELARQLKERDPKHAMDILQTARAAAAAADLDQATHDLLLKRVDHEINDLRAYVASHQPQIDLDTKNRAIRDSVDRDRINKVEVQEKMAMMVDDFNHLIEQKRFGEAEVIAKKAAELNPKDPVATQLVLESRLIRNIELSRQTQADKEDYFIDALHEVDVASVGQIENYSFGAHDAKSWRELSASRGKRMADGRSRRTPREQQIERNLSTPVSLKFKQEPLSNVISYLSRVTDINIYLDPQGLAAEAVTDSTPITIDLPKDIQVKSALKLILEPLHLNYIIRDEVLKITSEQMRDVNVYTQTYQVADLVIPIPNFVPGNGMGLEGAMKNAFDRQRDMAQSRYSVPTIAQAPMAVVSADKNSKINPQVLAQMQNMGLTGPQAGTPQQPGFGPGGVSGGNKADFDTLIDLITSTIVPPSWDAVGGQGSIKGFDTNLSLVISNTQEVHEEIADLLGQLRRQQDLQVTIEVRFITLTDNFFERIGLDFDLNISDRSSATPATLANNQAAHVPSNITVGIDPTSYPNLAPTSDLNLQLQQFSSGAALPPFGGFQATQVASFGFAILSDIEAFFLVQAAQGDSRTNILQAPKVTLFNGQQAFVSDTSQRPFVTSVTPVVGEFAAAQQPIITVLSEGTSLTVQAVVSNDRRFVRLTVVPFFSQIGNVDTFTFTGTTTSTTGSSTSQDDTAQSSSATNNATNTTNGTTVQLPTFSFVTVTTTVSVPDGGTVLLGGIKRLSEGRNEQGLPVLSKLPYISRLFKNVGIGRETQSLMMMVTPRIIIQEEEEERLLGPGGVGS